MPDRRARGPSLGARLSGALRRAAAAAAERPERTRDATHGELAARSRRDFLLFGAGALATAAVGWWLLPERAKRTWLPGANERLDTLAARVGLTRVGWPRLRRPACRLPAGPGSALGGHALRRELERRRRDRALLREHRHGDRATPPVAARHAPRRRSADARARRAAPARGADEAGL